MTRCEIYLDNNATTRVLPEVVDAVASAMRDCGNPSSVHGAGSRARARLGEAREKVAAALSGQPGEVLFTSGATEANNLVIQSLLRGPMKGYRLVTSRVEHSSVLVAAECLGRWGHEVVIVPVDEDGLVCQDAIAGSISPGRTLVSVQWANNETGVIQPIARLAKRARSAGALFHTDAAQAVGKIPVDLSRVPVDFMSMSAHKVHGPPGVGALVARKRNLLAPSFSEAPKSTRCGQAPRTFRQSSDSVSRYHCVPYTSGPPCCAPKR